MSAPGLTSAQWRTKLSEIAAHLQQPTSLCLIGSAPGMFAGQPQRMSIDLDTWQEASKFAYADLQQACEKAGLLFNPRDELEPTTPYIQLVEVGIVQVGKFTQRTKLMEEGQLVVVRPPIENIIAAKLLRASPKDLTDIAFLAAHYDVTRDQVARVIRSFPAPKRQEAQENLVYLATLTKGSPDL